MVALMAVPASAADQSVTARDNTFSPDHVTIDVGDKVTWTNSGLLPHNVKFSNGSFEEPAEPEATSWTVERTFDRPGSFTYYCTVHGRDNMNGTLTVTAGAAAEEPVGGDPMLAAAP